MAGETLPPSVSAGAKHHHSHPTTALSMNAEDKKIMKGRGSIEHCAWVCKGKLVRVESGEERKQRLLTRRSRSNHPSTDNGHGVSWVLSPCCGRSTVLFACVCSSPLVGLEEVLGSSEQHLAQSHDPLTHHPITHRHSIEDTHSARIYTELKSSGICASPDLKIRTRVLCAYDTAAPIPSAEYRTGSTKPSSLGTVVSRNTRPVRPHMLCMHDTACCPFSSESSAGVLINITSTKSPPEASSYECTINSPASKVRNHSGRPAPG